MNTSKVDQAQEARVHKSHAHSSPNTFDGHLFGTEKELYFKGSMGHDNGGTSI